MSIIMDVHFVVIKLSLVPSTMLLAVNMSFLRWKLELGGFYDETTMKLLKQLVQIRHVCRLVYIRKPSL